MCILVANVYLFRNEFQTQFGNQMSILRKENVCKQLFKEYTNFKKNKEQNSYRPVLQKVLSLDLQYLCWFVSQGFL